MFQENKLYTIKQICDIVGCHPETIRRQIKEGKIKAIPHTGKQHIRIFGFELMKYLGMPVKTNVKY